MGNKNDLQGKLTLLLESLDSREIRRLEEYLMSPFHNKNERLRKFFSLLKKVHPHYHKITKQQLFRKMFPEKKTYKDSDIRVLASDLTKHIKKFLVLQEMERVPMQQDYLLLEALFSRNIADAFQSTWEKIQRKLAHLPQGLDYYYYGYKFEEIAFRFTTIHHNRTLQANLQQAADYLDKYYFTNKLGFFIFMRNRQQIVNVSYQYYLLDDLLELVKKEATFQEPAIYLRYLTVLILNDLNDVSFYKLWKDFLIEHQEEMPPYELKQFYQLGVNYCRWQDNKGIHEFRRETFDWYKRMVERGLHYTGKNARTNLLSPHHYRNFVKTALELKEYEWASDFMLKYKEDVAPAFQENVLRHNQANYHFSKGEFNKAADILKEISFSGQEFIDFYYHLYYKSLLLQVAFELEETELLLSTMHSLELYLRRNKKITPLFRKSYLNFIAVVRKIHHKKEGKTIQSPNLPKYIETQSPIVEKEWLIAKAKEL